METARVYDVGSRKVIEIPAAELAPGMVAANMEDIEETVCIDASQLHQSEPIHDPFPEEVRDLLRQLKAAIDEVYCLSLEEWEDGFRRDRNPEPEITGWLHLGETYKRPASDALLTVEQKKDVFNVLSACLCAPREKVLLIANRGALSPLEAQRIVDAFYERRDET